jgi:hypothetical protein
MSDSSPTPGSLSPPLSPWRQPYGRQLSPHVPLTPSRLRESVAQSPVEQMAKSPSQDAERDRRYSPLSSPILQPEHGDPSTTSGEELVADNALTQGDIVEPAQAEPNARTRLLEDYHRGAACGLRNCNHGTFSPRPRSYQNSISSGNEPVDRYGSGIEGDGGAADQSSRLFGDPFADTIFGERRRDKKMSTTQWLAFKHGVKNPRLLLVMTRPL